MDGDRVLDSALDDMRRRIDVGEGHPPGSTAEASEAMPDLSTHFGYWLDPKSLNKFELAGTFLNHIGYRVFVHDMIRRGVSCLETEHMCLGKGPLWLGKAACDKSRPTDGVALCGTINHQGGAQGLSSTDLDRHRYDTVLAFAGR